MEGLVDGGVEGQLHDPCFLFCLAGSDSSASESSGTMWGLPRHW